MASRPLEPIVPRDASTPGSANQLERLDFLSKTYWKSAMEASSTERSPFACSKQIRSDVSNFNAFVNTWVEPCLVMENWTVSFEVSNRISAQAKGLKCFFRTKPSGILPNSNFIF